jgi:hypothetical protein
MSRTTKVLAATVAVAAVAAAGAYAFAQGYDQGRMGMGHGGGMHGMGQGGGMHGMGPGTMKGMMGGGRGGMMGNQADPAARLDAIKAELAIKPEQAADWEAYAKVVTDIAAERREHREKIDRDAVRNMDPKDREAFRDQMMKQRDESFAKVRTAAQTLLAKLDDAQKQKARNTLPGLASAGSGDGFRQGMMGGHGGHGMGHGMGDRHGHGHGQERGQGREMGPRWQR